mgnify:CR=1 FL=1
MHNDFSANFPDENKKDNFKSLYQLYDTLKVQKQEQTSKELIYRSILNSIDTAALILERQDDDWSIFIMNDCFSNLYKVPKVAKAMWRAQSKKNGLLSSSKSRKVPPPNAVIPATTQTPTASSFFCAAVNRPERAKAIVATTSIRV